MRLDHLGDEDFQFAMNYVDNEAFQNSTLWPLLQQQVLSGIDADYLKADDETFGLTVDNPVPVNGPIGQQTYLSRLRTPEGQGFVFHRLGSEGLVDLYEAISFDGLHELEIFMDMYHPRRSRLPIPGYFLLEEPQALTGFTTTMPLFPINYHRQLLQEQESIRVAFATSQQMDPIMKHFMDTFLEFEDEETEGKTEDEFLDDYNWRTKVSDEEWEKAKELRGYIVPTAPGGLLVFGQQDGVYGWTPSAAKAKRMKMNLDDLYDPVAVLILDGVEDYFNRLPEDAGSFMNISPDHVYFDEEGFYTTFIVTESSDDIPEALALMDFLTEYYFRTRTYPITAWISRGDGVSSDGNRNVSHLNFRWGTSQALLGEKYTQKQSNLKRQKPFKLNPNGTLTKLDPVVARKCPICGEWNIVWSDQNKRLALEHFESKKTTDLVKLLTPSDREAIMTGLHDWCFG